MPTVWKPLSKAVTNIASSTMKGMGLRILMGAMASHYFTESQAIVSLPRKCLYFIWMATMACLPAETPNWLSYKYCA